MKNYIGLFFTGFAFLFIGCSSDSTDDISEPPEGPVTYNEQIRSIFNNNCVSCHGEVMPSGGLSLHNYEAVRAGVEVGNVLNRMTNAGAPMPPSGLLPSSTVELIQQWADEGFVEE